MFLKQPFSSNPNLWKKPSLWETSRSWKTKCPKICTRWKRSSILRSTVPLPLTYARNQNHETPTYEKPSLWETFRPVNKSNDVL